MSNFFETNLGTGLLGAGEDILNQGISWLRDRDARRWQEEMWNKQNEYNLPVNQRKRLEDAGINPNLAFGSAASAMGTSVPGSPSVHVPKMNVAQFWLEYKKAKAQIDRENQLTRQLELNNQVFELLFNDKVKTEQGDLYVRRIKQAWDEDHLKQLLDAGLTEKELRNDLLRLQKTYQENDNKKLQREVEHLAAKYGFEDFFYDNMLNPYAGGAFTLGWNAGKMLYDILEHLLSLF